MQEQITNQQVGNASSYFLGEPDTPAVNPVPQRVSMRQARLALLAINKLSAVTAIISALPANQKQAAEITWEYSQEVQRYNGLVSQLAPAMGMTELDIDNLFIAASKL